jgi:hypothetical protein
MARGQSQAASSQLNTTNQIGQNELGQANQLESSLIPDYQTDLTQGYTPQEQTAMTTAGEGAIGSAYGSAAQDAARTAGRTNNASSLTAGQDQMALNKGTAMGQEAAGLQTEFANQQQTNRARGEQGIGNLEAGNLQSGDMMYGLGPGTLQARAAGTSGDQLAQGWVNTALGNG